MATQKDELAGLSATERAAIEDDDDDRAALKAIAGDGADEGDEGDDDADGDDTAEGAVEDDAGDGNDADDAEAGDDKSGKDAAGADDKSKDAAKEKKADAEDGADAADKPVEVIDEDEAEVATLPTLKVEVPQDADEQLKQLKADKRALFKEYNDGKIDEAAYEQKLEEVDDKIGTINEALATQRMNQQISAANEEKMASEWSRKVSSFMDEVKRTEGIDYRTNKALGSALDGVVKDLGATKENADKPMGWFLREAHRQVKASFGVVAVPKGEKGAAAAAASGTQQAQESAGRKPKAPDTSKVPPSLRRAPEAAPEDDGGEFSHLSTLSGMALERAVAKLTPDQQSRWAEAD